VKTEKEEKNNMILLGGPGTNLLSAEINRYLPIKFDEKNYWGGIIDHEDRCFNLDRDGIIAKIQNPYDKKNSIIILAGNRHIGTKAAILGATKYWRAIIGSYQNEDSWAVAVRGLDLDSDGKIDTAELLSRS